MHDSSVDRLGTGDAVTIGVTGGVVGGLLGGGSGVFFVPALDRFAGLPRTVLHGTSTVANIAVCAIGATVYALAGGAIDLRAGSGLIIGGIIGAFSVPALFRVSPSVPCGCCSSRWSC